MIDFEEDSTMASRRPAPHFLPPLPPEPPSAPQVVRHSAISAHEAWDDEQVFDADLAGHVAEHARLTRCELHRVVLTGAQLRGLTLVDVLAVDCEFSGAYLHEASLRRVELRNCRMTGVVISQSTMNHVRFVDCKLDEANVRLARSDHVQMIDCSLLGADFHEAVLAESMLDGCDLRGSDFSKTSVQGLRLVRSRLDGVRGAMSMGGVVIAGDQVLPLALSLFAELRIEIQNGEEAGSRRRGDSRPAIRRSVRDVDERYVAVIGPSEAAAEELARADAVGRLLAQAGAVVFCGGLGGVMEAVARGAAAAGGTVIGVLPGRARVDANPHVTVAITTGMGEMRNALIVRAVDVVIALGGAYGTLSEIAFALRTGVPVVGLNTWDLDDVIDAPDPEAAVALALELAAT